MTTCDNIVYLRPENRHDGLDADAEESIRRTAVGSRVGAGAEGKSMHGAAPREEKKIIKKVLRKKKKNGKDSTYLVSNHVETTEEEADKNAAASSC